MDPQSWNQRLSRISTLWTLLQQAHAGPADAATTAQRLLMHRYLGAVYRYLLGALRSEDAAEELLQEFALRFLRGDFRRADPERGRFRDYVKTALCNLVNDHRRAQREQPGPLPDDYPEPAPAGADDVQFLDSWRDELLARAWAALGESHPTLFAVLLVRVQHPEMPSPQLAERLSADLGRAFTAGQVRVTLHRAREKYAELLLEEVQHSLDLAGEAALVQELRDLRLLQLCGPALERGSHPSPAKHPARSPGREV